jgi:hypothetical protein
MGWGDQTFITAGGFISIKCHKIVCKLSSPVVTHNLLTFATELGCRRSLCSWKSWDAQLFNGTKIVQIRCYASSVEKVNK